MHLETKEIIEHFNEITPDKIALLGKIKFRTKQEVEVIAMKLKIICGMQEKGENLMYSEAKEVEMLAEQVIDYYGDHLPSVYGQPLRIKYLFKNSKKSQYLGKCSRATGKWAHLTGMDYIIEIWYPWWSQASENERKALLFHELKHIKLEESETPDGDIEIKWGIQKHDSELFVKEFELFGAWRPDYEEIARVCKTI